MARVGAFEISEPVPEIASSRLLITLRPWVDAGSVGTMTLNWLEEHWRAEEIGRLVRPGEFFDFTRYRPMITHRDGRRQITVPNTVVRLATTDSGDTWLFMHALEPQNHAEDYNDSVLELMRRFNVREYVMVGSMYGPVPHTRPPVLSGGSQDDELRRRLEGQGIRGSTYEGPTSIVSTLTERAREELGVQSGTMLVQLPAYAQLELDFRGRYALIDKLSSMYGLSLDLEEVRDEGEKQYASLNSMLDGNPALRGWVREQEATFDAAVESAAPSETGPPLSPELERFLREVQRKWDD